MAIGVWFSWVVLLIVSVLAILRIMVLMELLDRMPILKDLFGTKTPRPSIPTPPPPPTPTPTPQVHHKDDTLGKTDHEQSLNDEIHAKNIDKIQSAFSDISTEEYVKATIFVQLPSIVEYVSHLPSEAADKFADFCHHAVLTLELIGTEVDPITGCENITPTAPAHHSTAKDEVYTPVAKDDKTAKDGYKPPEVEYAKYVAYIEIKPGFGEVGAVQVENEHRTEMHVINIVLERFPEMSQQTISCNSWVHPKSVNTEKRVFFTNKSYLPLKTPSGLIRLRGYELDILRGDTKPKEKRLHHDRIYDYDFYNDLGDPGNDRPCLGGEKFPYPRRCKTGSLIKRGSIISLFRENVYVPRDETFSELKLKEFGFRALYTLLHHIIPPLETKFINDKKEYPFITAINKLFNEEIKCPEMEDHGGVQDVVHRFIRDASDSAEKVFRFELPDTFERDAFSWFKDEEFARQTLAGMNPLSIKCVDMLMMESILNLKICGKFNSVLTEKLLDKELNRLYHMSLKEAVQNNKLFIIDYHDAFMPYVNKVLELKEERYLYASRTLFIHDEDGALKPLAIELTRPPTKEDPDQPYQEVFMPRNNATEGWLWKLAKAHVLAHDTGYHQLISHWLRAHCCTEPYIIAANRQLSAMHPIYRLLHPHFRYTMEINALARLALINADGIIEKNFSPGKYCLEMSSAIYKSEWRFDREALPDDLLHRRMAVKDTLAESGVRLIIEDYPYAKDGLQLWVCIKKWVTKYVYHYYTESKLVESDQELQAWWTEIRTVGHGDKKEGWLPLNTQEDLIRIVSTIIWVTSGHHAAVNFGQYAYAGYFPNRPTITRTKMPTEYRYPNPDKPSEYLYTDRKKWNSFIRSPEKTLLECFPTMQQAATVMAVLDVLSSHSSEEEYIGQHMEPSWKAEEAISTAFKEFHDGLEDLNKDITKRNDDETLKHRYGAGVVPYELLRPKSDEAGVTGKGVPNSISI